MGNSIGNIIRLTTFGESHGPCIGGVLDGFPSNFEVDFEKIRSRMKERSPGSSSLVTTRKEDDEVEILSGIFNGRTTGTPIGFIIRNSDVRSDDYSEMKDAYRMGHADYSYQLKYGIRDYRGGGRASARSTASIVFAGALCSQILEKLGIKVSVSLSVAGTYENIEDVILRCKESGDSCGGIVTGKISGVPEGLGEPVFDKLQASLSHAMLSINAVKGFDYGSGFRSGVMSGSQLADRYFKIDNKLVSGHNYQGGISGGISTGEDIDFRVAFKPTPTTPLNNKLYKEDGTGIERKRIGRHDPCVAVRGQYVVRAMAEIIILDHYLIQRAYKGLKDEYLV